jgi:hypothetical protein
MMELFHACSDGPAGATEPNILLRDLRCLPDRPEGFPDGSDHDGRRAYQQPDGVQAQTGNDNVRHRRQ